MVFREPSVGRYDGEPPQQIATGATSWITRGANFAVVFTRAEAGATLAGEARDEQFVYALEGGIVAEAGGLRERLDVEDLAILPPGPWTLHFERAVQLVQLVTAD